MLPAEKSPGHVPKGCIIQASLFGPIRPTACPTPALPLEWASVARGLQASEKVTESLPLETLSPLPPGPRFGSPDTATPWPGIAHLYTFPDVCGGVKDETPA